MSVSPTNDQEFDTEVLTSSQPVLVDFWAPWCGPCKQLSPVLERMSTEYESIKFVSVNADDNLATASRYSVMSLPTLVLFENGEPISRVVGARSQAALVKALGI